MLKRIDSTFPSFVKTFESSREACSSTQICKIADYRNFFTADPTIYFISNIFRRQHLFTFDASNAIIYTDVNKEFFTYKEG
jgi:hypothetical protein